LTRDTTHPSLIVSCRVSQLSLDSSLFGIDTRGLRSPFSYIFQKAQYPPNPPRVSTYTAKSLRHGHIPSLTFSARFPSRLMTEYDYSPEAVERHIAKQYRISEWVAEQPNLYPNPFLPSPSHLGKDDLQLPETPRPTPRRARTHHGHGHEHKHRHHHHRRSPSDAQTYTSTLAPKPPYPSRSMTSPPGFYYTAPAMAVPRPVPYPLGTMGSPIIQQTLPNQTTVTYAYVPQSHTTSVSTVRKFSSVIKRIFKAIGTANSSNDSRSPAGSREDSGSGSSGSRSRGQRPSIEKGWAFVDTVSRGNGSAIEWKDSHPSRRRSSSRHSSSRDSGGRRRRRRDHSR
jgi:hypothetical protein